MHPSRCTCCRSFLALVLVALLIAPVFAAKKPPAKKDDAARNAAGRRAVDALLPGDRRAGACRAGEGGQGQAHVCDRSQWAQGLARHPPGGRVGHLSRLLSHDQRQTTRRTRRKVERASATANEIGGMMDQQGNRIFEHVFFVELAAPDPGRAAGVEPDQRRRVLHPADRRVQGQPAAQGGGGRSRPRGAGRRGSRRTTTTARRPARSASARGRAARSASRKSRPPRPARTRRTQDILVLPTPLPNQEKMDVRNDEGQRVKTLRAALRSRSIRR